MEMSVKRANTGTYEDLLSSGDGKQGKSTVSYEAKPAYVNTAPRDPNKSGADAECLYEPLEPSTVASRDTIGPPSPVYVNTQDTALPFKYA